MTGHIGMSRESSLVLTRKLANYIDLSIADEHALEAIVQERITTFAPREDILVEGEQQDSCATIMSGWACRYKVLEDGRRQILSFLVPGDLCDHGALLGVRSDCSIATLTSVTCAHIPRTQFDPIAADNPTIARAILLDLLATSAIQREWTLNLGQRGAYERLAHLFCEMFVRLEAIGLTDRQACTLPITQSDIADATGLSSVHVNRTLQELRGANLVVLRGKTLEIPDFAALKAAALFTSDYLRLGTVSNSAS